MERNLLFKEVQYLRYDTNPSVLTLENETFEKEIAPYKVNNTLIENPAISFKTLYLETNIGIQEKVPRLTGVYLPRDFSQQKQLDVIIYFHGLVKGICRDQPSEFKRRGVAYYWQSPKDAKAQPNFQLRELLGSASRKAILIVPTLGTNSQNDFGNLSQGAFFDLYLNRILKTLKTEQLVSAEAGWRNIILAGHSAGGNLMQKIVRLKNSQSSYVKNIQECWGLDCFYYGVENWKTWLEHKNPDQRLLAFHTGNGKSASAAKSLKSFADEQQIENVFEKTMGKTSQHCSMVSKIWQTLVNNCPFLEK